MHAPQPGLMLTWLSASCTRLRMALGTDIVSFHLQLVRSNSLECLLTHWGIGSHCGAAWAQISRGRSSAAVAFLVILGEPMASQEKSFSKQQGEAGPGPCPACALAKHSVLVAVRQSVTVSSGATSQLHHFRPSNPASSTKPSAQVTSQSHELSPALQSRHVPFILSEGKCFSRKTCTGALGTSPHRGGSGAGAHRGSSPWSNGGSPEKLRRPTEPPPRWTCVPSVHHTSPVKTSSSNQWSPTFLNSMPSIGSGYRLLVRQSGSPAHTATGTSRKMAHWIGASTGRPSNSLSLAHRMGLSPLMGQPDCSQQHLSWPSALW
mmetsp:Transcript_32900/g.99369  ORF Transcript_32900/g.99369 Transcript_32900/m.99369 type:complete len:320 (-) Transcript_32900:1619-2578(-)